MRHGWPSPVLASPAQASKHVAHGPTGECACKRDTTDHHDTAGDGFGKKQIATQQGRHEKRNGGQREQNAKDRQEQQGLEPVVDADRSRPR